MSLLHAVPLSHEQPIPQGAGAAKPRTKKAGSGDKDRVAVHQRASSRHVVQAAFLALGEQPQPIAKNWAAARQVHSRLAESLRTGHALPTTSRVAAHRACLAGCPPRPSEGRCSQTRLITQAA